MLMGWLAICGIPIWAGFFSKDEILYKTFSAQNLPDPWNYILWGLGLFTALLTAVYMTRMMWMTFFGTERFHEELEAPAAVVDNHGDEHTDDDEDEHHALPHDFKPHESSWVMTVPLIILAILSTFGGLVGVPYALSGGTIPNQFEHILQPVIAKVGPEEVHDGHAPEEVKHFFASSASTTEEAHSAEEVRTERILAGLSVVIALLGIGIGVALFGKTPLRKMPKILEDKWRVDEFYNGYIVDPITNFSREVLWKGFDLGFIDGIVNGLGHLVSQLGNLARSVQVGFVRSYAALIILGALAVIGYFIFYGLKLVG
jgi:NADH-quinone oxidoreductase subunit L